MGTLQRWRTACRDRCPMALGMVPKPCLHGGVVLSFIFHKLLWRKQSCLQSFIHFPVWDKKQKKKTPNPSIFTIRGFFKCSYSLSRSWNTNVLTSCWPENSLWLLPLCTRFLPLTLMGKLLNPLTESPKSSWSQRVTVNKELARFHGVFSWPVFRLVTGFAV